MGSQNWSSATSSCLLARLPRELHAKEEMDRKAGELGIGGTIRAEDLDTEQHLRLCEAFG
jgi:hypothetical protein